MSHYWTSEILGVRTGDLVAMVTSDHHVLFFLFLLSTPVLSLGEDNGKKME